MAADTVVVEGDSSSVRERVLDAAAKVLCEKGFAGVRLADIAAEAGVAVSVIYYDYASREDLIEEVVFLGAAALRQHLVTVLKNLPKRTSPAERISRAVEAHLRRQQALAHYALAIEREVPQLPEPVSRRARGELAAYGELWDTLIVGLQSAGQLRGGVEPAVARLLVLGALAGAVEWLTPDTLGSVVANAQSMVLAALRK